MGDALGHATEPRLIVAALAMAARDNTVAYASRRLQLPASKLRADNYSVAMFSFEYLHSHFMYEKGLVNLRIRSSVFWKPLRPKTIYF